MIEQIKYSGIAAITAASGGAAILNEQTLLPLSIFCAGIGVACITAWHSFNLRHLLPISKPEPSWKPMAGFHLRTSK